MDFQLLKQIVETPAAPGFEQELREFIRQRAEPYCDDIHVDSIGNLTARIKGGKTPVMAAAHMDEIALISTHVDDQGFIRFHTMGGFDPRTLYTQPVTVLGKQRLPGVIGGKPAHLLEEDQKKQAPRVDQLFIDTGLPADELKDLVPVGTPIVRNRELTRMGNLISGKSLDNRLSVYLLLEALKQAPELDIDFHAVFTVQEEIGIRGARIAAQRIQPEIGIGLDITLANDIAGVEKQSRITELGQGPAVKVMDSSVLCTPSLVAFFEETADKYEIPYQREVLTAGGTDTSAMQYLTGLGAHVTCISTPTRYVHSPVETASISDLDYGVNLLNTVLQHLHQYNVQ